MNEIKISIDYSDFVDFFVCYFYERMNSGVATSVTKALDDAKKYWLLFDSALRNDVIRTAETANYPSVVKNYVAHFIEWANQQFCAKQECSTARPLVNVLPVIDLKLYGRNQK